MGRWRKIVRDYELSGLKAPSYNSVRRIIATISPDLVARFRIGEREFDDKFAYIILRRKPALPREWVDADHTPMDHNVVFPDGSIGRPWLTAMQDICTGEILGFYLTREKPVGKGSYPGAAAIGICLRHAILKKAEPGWPSFGLFKNLYVDLGRDFRSEHVRAVCHDLGIEIVHTRGYHGKSKPIERWFRTLKEDLRDVPGYCGNSPAENPARQKLKPEPLDPKSLITIAEYEAKLADYIINVFHHRPSKALSGLSPLDALAAHVKNGFTAREIQNERALDLVLMRRHNKLVRNAGVQHFNRFFVAPELLSMIGQRVDIAWDPAEAGTLLIYKDDRFICAATNRELVDFGASEETLAREREIKRQQKRSVEERYQEILKRAQYPNPLARAAAEEREQKFVEEERRAIAAGASAPSAAVLLPKFAGAAKALRADRAPGTGDRRRATSDRKPGTVEKNPWLEEEELKPFRPKKERNPWMVEDKE